MKKIEELEQKINELDGELLKLKKDYKNRIYELDENNFSTEFLKKLGYKGGTSGE